MGALWRLFRPGRENDMKKPTKPTIRRWRKGQHCQLPGDPWKYGPGTVTKVLHGAVEVKWPRKGRKTTHNSHYLVRVEEVRT
jgi:hypothetical protein